jgi:TonB family protein
LLESMNPCAIPEQELKRPPKDCKHCARFSGADPSMRVRCGTNTRVIPSRIFEDFWFNHDAKPPKTTFSMLQLLKRLDDAVGPGVMEKPAFSSPDDGDQRTKLPEAEVLQQLGRGEFDNLFKASPDKPSELYLAAQKFPPTPSVRLLESVPYAPEVLVLPKYPPLARAASIEGQVTFTAGLDSNGSLTEVVFVNGHQVLQSAVRESMDSWRFPKEAADQKIHGTIEFFLNCHVH